MPSGWGAGLQELGRGLLGLADRQASLENQKLLQAIEDRRLMEQRQFQQQQLEAQQAFSREEAERQASLDRDRFQVGMLPAGTEVDPQLSGNLVRDYPLLFKRQQVATGPLDVGSVGEEGTGFAGAGRSVQLGEAPESRERITFQGQPASTTNALIREHTAQQKAMFDAQIQRQKMAIEEAKLKLDTAAAAMRQQMNEAQLEQFDRNYQLNLARLNAYERQLDQAERFNQEATDTRIMIANMQELGRQYRTMLNVNSGAGNQGADWLGMLMADQLDIDTSQFMPQERPQVEVPPPPQTVPLPNRSPIAPPPPQTSPLGAAIQEALRNLQQRGSGGGR